MGNVLELIRFSAGYGKNDVLKEMDLTLYAGETAALVGENGCGKTTLLRCCAGLMKGRGTYLRMGEKADLSARANARFAVYLAQQSRTELNLNVLDFMLLGLYGRKERLTEKAVCALASFGCGDLIEKDIMNLSGGQKQLVRLAALTLREGRILLLDEPDGALDIGNRMKVLSHIRSRVKRTGEAVLMSCHDVNAALACADRLIFLKDGKIAADVRTDGADAETLQSAFGLVFPGTEIIMHDGNYILTGGKP